PLVPETLANIFFFLSFSPFTSILGKKGVYFYVTRSIFSLFYGFICDLEKLFVVINELAAEILG
ncbi:hypothetical protein, partial [Leptospira interrogans]|uniref:hypothetical protein n=1 Tax=Leptospira interrogans TaxID=173 RepID=UPI0002B94712